MHPNLSFDQAPPISVPYRFFLTAPWFGVAAGLLLAWQGPEALGSRWSPGALAATHLLAVGYMLQAMAGALFQFVPVAAGGNVWRPRLVAAAVHPALIVAAIVLVLALAGGTTLFRLAGPLFLLAVGAYVAVVGTALWRTTARGPAIAALRLAVPALGLTAILGATLAEGLGRGQSWPFVELANVHAAWGLGGWALLLLAGVSYYVVPMFQLTPPYPHRLARLLPPALLVALTAWSWQLAGETPAWETAVFLAGLSVAAVYGATTLWLQGRRRRKVPDPTLYLFRAAMICLLAILSSAIAFTAWPDLGLHPRAAVWIGVLALPGVFVSAINGMLYKIVPFLNWLHLQRIGGATMMPPNMKEMIPEAAIVGQMRLHFAALVALLAAVLWPALTAAAGALFAVSCAWLGWNLLRGVRNYLKFKGRIPAGGADSGR